MGVVFGQFPEVSGGAEEAWVVGAAVAAGSGVEVTELGTSKNRFETAIFDPEWAVVESISGYCCYFAPNRGIVSAGGRHLVRV
ncbi:hypothetical protein, partial [Methylocaldum sp.]|uniref:hypothetical protein n=1 Tax=Methylocaldum sp. TaxID=1969727 RepID=UPI002D6A55CD